MNDKEIIIKNIRSYISDIETKCRNLSYEIDKLRELENE